MPRPIVPKPWSSVRSDNGLDAEDKTKFVAAFVPCVRTE
jgi:hypothetical protein